MAGAGRWQGGPRDAGPGAARRPVPSPQAGRGPAGLPGPGSGRSPARRGAGRARTRGRGDATGRSLPRPWPPRLATALRPPLRHAPSPAERPPGASATRPAGVSCRIPAGRMTRARPGHARPGARCGGVRGPDADRRGDGAPGHGGPDPAKPPTSAKPLENGHRKRCSGNGGRDRGGRLVRPGIGPRSRTKRLSGPKRRVWRGVKGTGGETSRPASTTRLRTSHDCHAFLRPLTMAHVARRCDGPTAPQR